MSVEICDREAEILAILRHNNGRQSEAADAAEADAADLGSPASDSDAAAHVAACPSCALAAAAERWMLAAASELRPVALPTPGSLVLRAQLRTRRLAAERSLRPLVIWRRAALAVGIILVVVVSNGPFLDGLRSPGATGGMALLAAGAVALGALPIWLRLRRDAA